MKVGQIPDAAGAERQQRGSGGLVTVPTQLAVLPRPARANSPAIGLIVVACLGLLALYAKLLLARWRAPQALDDFAVFWVAGRLALAGKAAAAYDWVGLNRLLDAGFGAPDYARGFYYPPLMFLLVAPFGLLPFAAAAAAWLAAGMAAYAAALGAILRRGTFLLAALAAPVVMYNFATGQNGLLLAALIGGALILLDVRPVLSGAFIGLLAVKPHFGLLWPLFLAATGRWRVFASAAATVAILATATAILFGAGIFVAFFHALPAAADGYVQREGLKRVIAWSDLESVYGLLRALGFGGPVAWIGHIAVGVLAAAACLRLAMRRSLQMAAVAAATMLLTPYSELNDVAILMVAWAFLLRDGLEHGLCFVEKAGLTFVMLLPLLYLPARAIAKALGWSAVSSGWAGMGPLMCTILFALVFGRIGGSGGGTAPAREAAR